MKLARTMRGLAVAGALSLALALPTVAVAQENAGRFAGEIGEFAFRDKVLMPEPCKLLFVGSSSIRLWVGLERDFAVFEPIQRGFGGSQTEDANRYFDQLVARYKPAKIVLYEGENDINAGKSVDVVEADLREFLDLKTNALGSTPVYYIATKPSPSRWAQYEKQKALNARMKALAEARDDLVYIDIVSGMLDDDGKPRPDIFVSDNLHMNHRGYEKWRAAVYAALTQPASTAPHC
ncbi:GDSL-type esterase/lipase family protein [Qipengyuania sp.]|uniref:GDSL-type esterase/lipase family protein n=1 Tax=Qipengyuania sp. TaxID=2004515 RepID=UPI0035C7B6D1